MAKRILRDLRLDKIAAVDKPCQEHATAPIMKRRDDQDGEPYWKREFDAEQRDRLAGTGAAMPDGSFPIANVGDLKNAVEAFGRAKDPEKAKAHIISRAKSLGETKLLPEDWVGKGAGDGTNPHVGDQNMDELQKKIDAAVAAALAPVNKSLEEAQAHATSILAMSKAERDAMDDMDDDEKKDFIAAKPGDRKSKMKKRAEENPVIFKAADGTEFRQSDDPRLAKMAKERDEDRALAKAEREARELSEFKKRADDDFGNVPGTTDERAAMLKAMSGMDDKVKASFEAVLKAHQDVVKNAFTTFGHQHSQLDQGTPEARLDKMAVDHAKENKISKSVAYDEVLKSEEGRKLYAESIRAAPVMMTPQ